MPTNLLKFPYTLINSSLSLYGEPPQELPETRYYQESTSDEARYRIFSMTSDRIGSLLPQHPIFSSVFLGDVQVPAADWTLTDLREADHLTNPRPRDFYQFGTPTIKNGALFRKDGTIIEKRGIVIMPGEPFSHCYLVLSNYKNVEFDQMCFEEHAVITKQSVDIPGMAFLINAFGGFETIDEQRIGFIEPVNEAPAYSAESGIRAAAGAEPSPSTRNISMAQARMLLPYLYLLEDSQSIEADQETRIAQTSAAIHLLETILTVESDEPTLENSSAEEEKCEAVSDTAAAIGTKTSFKKKRGKKPKAALAKCARKEQ